MTLSKFESDNTWCFSPDHGQLCQVIGDVASVPDRRRFSPIAEPELLSRSF